MRPSLSLETSKWEHIPVVIFEQPRIAAARVGAGDCPARARAREPTGSRWCLGWPPARRRYLSTRNWRGFIARRGSVSTMSSRSTSTSISPFRRSMRRVITASCASISSIISTSREHQIHIPSGSTTRAEVSAACEKYERMIVEAGGIDLQILGIGRTGHIGFNEPGSSRRSVTRLIHLDRLTRLDAIRDFQSEELVPAHGGDDGREVDSAGAPHRHHGVWRAQGGYRRARGRGRSKRRGDGDVSPGPRELPDGARRGGGEPV